MTKVNLTDEVARLVRFAETHHSPHAYRYFYRQDLVDDDRIPSSGELIEVRAFADGSYTVTPTDRAGRPIDQPRPKHPDDQPFTVGHAVVQPVQRRTIRDEIREEERARLEAQMAELAEQARLAEVAEEEAADAKAAVDEVKQVLVSEVAPELSAEKRSKLRRILLGD